MRELWDLASRVAPTDSTVLITGESGVGKERVARWLHEASPRATARFVPVNCAAVPDTLFESELFGHARGAFTGAVGDHPGLVEAAHGGTLFLDEVGEFSLAMQAKLLRVIQEREIRRVGETRLRPIDVRLIAATNRDLKDDVTQRRFREDLYYRLCVIDLHVPPLRERPDDLQPLADHFLARTATRLHRPLQGFTPGAWARLRAYHWPGNVRQLEHAIERACALTTDALMDVAHLPTDISGPLDRRRQTHSGLTLDRESIRQVVQRVGSQRYAAMALGISLSTLKRRLRPTASSRD
jgi:transcriptional regulator with PAS, ATPase and Fis domain